jgi:Na+-translocating ferredoxin:NAD+ oxidoreductase RNF subunit RnfB
MGHGIQINENACRGCVNCIKSCPTEAMRVIHGKVRILEERCIGCGECIRSCRHRALSLQENDWDKVSSIKPMTVAVDPALCTQFPWSPNPAVLEDALRSMAFEPIFGECAMAYDLAAMATARTIGDGSSVKFPVISTYCPAVVRIVQIKFQELLPHLAPVESPLETCIDLWRARHNKHDVPASLVVGCPARVAMVEDPVGRDASSVDYVVSTARMTREILSRSHGIKETAERKARDSRWLNWALLGGETRHVSQFSERPLKTLAVSGMRNVIAFLQDIELRRMQGLDFVELRACDLGCIGGISNAESRFLSRIKIENYGYSPALTEEDRKNLESLYDADIWKLQEEIKSIEQVPLGRDMAKAMEKLEELHAVYAELPHLDCGTCGRPSCRIMAEDIVRGEGSVDDCIFRLREKIASLSDEIHGLSRRLVHTMTREDQDENK